MGVKHKPLKEIEPKPTVGDMENGQYFIPQAGIFEERVCCRRKMTYFSDKLKNDVYVKVDVVMTLKRHAWMPTDEMTDIQVRELGCDDEVTLTFNQRGIA